MVLSHLGAAFIDELCSFIADHPAICSLVGYLCYAGSRSIFIGATPFVVDHSFSSNRRFSGRHFVCCRLHLFWPWLSESSRWSMRADIILLLNAIPSSENVAYERSHYCKNRTVLLNWRLSWLNVWPTAFMYGVRGTKNSSLNSWRLNWVLVGDVFGTLVTPSLSLKGQCSCCCGLTPTQRLATFDRCQKRSPNGRLTNFLLAG